MQLVIYLLIFNNPVSADKDDIEDEVRMIIPLVNVISWWSFTYLYWNVFSAISSCLTAGL